MGGSVNIKFSGKLLQTFSDSVCGTLPISGEAQIPKLILPFSTPFTLCGCCFCQSLYSSPSLSLSFFLLFMFVNHSLFLVFSLLLSPKLSYCFLWFSHPLYLCPCQLRPCFISSIPSASLSLPLSHSFSLGLREGDQNVCWRNRASSLFTPHYYCSI